MISVAAIRMQQFGVQFYQASLTAKDIDKLVRFEVLSYGEQGKGPGVRGSARQSKVHWDLLERRIASSEKAYQRQIIRKKIDELVAVLRAVPPGARPAVDSRRRHHLVRRAAEVRGHRGRSVDRHPQGAGARRASCAPSTDSTACSRCTPTSSTSAARTSRCRPSSSTGCRKITSCRCSSRSTRSTRG